MPQRSRETYHSDAGLEQAVIDLVKVGATGFAPGVRQLAARLVRAVPPGVTEPGRFRDALNEAIATGTASGVGMRLATAEIPTSADGGLELAEVDPLPEVHHFVLSPTIMASFEELVNERRHADDLARAGVPLTRTVLLSGPPGVGKTLGARWLAANLDLPLVTISLAAVTSSYLGSSGRNLRAVFDYAKSGPCVLLLDEFDALAKRRDDEADIGELKRLVNVILLELDRWPGSSLIVAATNHAQLLDPAVDRRFDRRIDISVPAADERARLLTELAADAHEEALDDVINLAVHAYDGESCSDIERTWRRCQRRAILGGRNLHEVLVEHLLTSEQPSDLRAQLWRLASTELGFSYRQIASAAGVSHPTVSAALRKTTKKAAAR